MTRDADNKPKRTRCAPRPVACWETGRIFPSMRAAAVAVDLKTGANIRFAIENHSIAGGYHWYWAGDPKPEVSEPEPKARDASRNEHREKKTSGCPVVCYESGEVFPSAAQAAKAVGLKWAKSIRQALDNPQRTAGGYHWHSEGSPKLDESELKKPKQKRKTTRKPPRKLKIPIVCLETQEVFPTAKEAAAVAGLKDASGINRALRKGSTAGGFHWYLQDGPEPNVHDQRVSQGGRPGRPVVCWETGQMYVSAQEAADAAGIKNRGNIRNAANTGIMAGGYHWYWADQPKPDASAFKSPKSRAVLCVETGVAYESAAAAARAIGAKHASAITRTVRKGGAAAGLHWRYVE